MVKLAAYLQNCEFRTLRTFSNYNVGDFQEDIRGALYAAGVDGSDTVLFLNDRYLVKVRDLYYLRSIQSCDAPFPLISIGCLFY